jgi:hypothetical protein
MTAMKKFTKGVKIEYILGTIALVVAGLALYKYSEEKNMSQAPMTPGPVSLGFSDVMNASVPNEASYQSYNGGQNTSNTSVAVSSTSGTLNRPASNPSDLLPSDMNNSWANLNPVGNADLRNINLLKPLNVSLEKSLMLLLMVMKMIYIETLMVEMKYEVDFD